MIVTTDRRDLSNLSNNEMFDAYEKISAIPTAPYSRGDVMDAEELIEGVFTDVDGFDVSQISVVPGYLALDSIKVGIAELRGLMRSRLDEQHIELLETYSLALRNITFISSLLTEIAGTKIRTNIDVSALRLNDISSYLFHTDDLACFTRDTWGRHDFEFRIQKDSDNSFVLKANTLIRDMVTTTNLTEGISDYDYTILRSFIKKEHITYDDIVSILANPTELINTINKQVDGLALTIANANRVDWNNIHLSRMSDADMRTLNGFAHDKLSMLSLYLTIIVRYQFKEV